MSRYLLLTGAAGLVGQYLLGDLLGKSIPTAVLMRARNGTAPEARVEKILARIETHLGRQLPRPVCLSGDISLPRLGLSGEACRWASEHCDRVLHNAACVTFHGADRQGDPWLSNVTGTANVLEFCRLAEIREFHYMSTAYVCGQRRGPILEDQREDPRQFRNDYEESKFAAEELVRSARFLGRPTIYRPATIVGDSSTGHTTTYHGLYHYLRFASVIRQSSRIDDDGRFHVAFRYNVTGDEPRNLVPVDWVSAVTVQILLDPRQHGRNYHLTPPRPMTMREIDHATSSYFRYYGQSFVGRDGLAHVELSDLERVFYGQMNGYQDYWADEPIFDSRNTLAAVPHLPCPPIDKELFGRLIDFAVRDRWGRAGKRQLT